MYNHFMAALITASPDSFLDFGELLRYLRERAELSQRELALQVGYHYSYMSRIESNERIPDSATLMARFVPALGLDDEPTWTARLLQLATTEGKTMSPRRGARVHASPALTVEYVPPIADTTLSPLPLSLTPLLGRAKETAAVTKILSRFDVHLVTLIGPPGVGKTRLAIQIANEAAGMFAHGAAFIDLTSFRDPRDFLPAVGKTLGIHGLSEMPLMTQLIHVLRHRNLLLVLDNFEHMIEAAPQVHQLLSNVPEIKALATSREALRISGENEFAVPPLPLPQRLPTGPLPQDYAGQNLMEFAAIQLFIQRAQAVQPDFQLIPENTDAVLEICRRLDGLPLAIELAAARIKTLTPQAMLSQFDRRLDWLARGTRDSQAWRHTLRGTIEWSHNLLSESEHILMRRLSVFSDGWTLTTAEAICGDAEHETTGSPLLRRGEILDLLIQLADKSLVVIEKMEEETRFYFLETIRDFAREKLESSGEDIKIRNRHLAYFAAFAEEAEVRIYSTSHVTWTSDMEREHANIRTALAWGLSEGASLEHGLRLVAAVSRFWIRRSYFREGFEWLNLYLQHATDPTHKLIRTKILYRAGGIAGYMFDYATGYKLCQQSMELARELDHKHYLAGALFYMSEIAMGLGHLKEARAGLEECISICWADYYPQLLNLSLASLGLILYEEGNPEAAHSTLEEALAIASRVDDTWGVSHALHNLGTINRFNKNYEQAVDYMERCLDMSLQIGDRHAQGTALSDLAIFHNLQNEYARSEDCAQRAFAIYQMMGDEYQRPFPLRLMGYAAIHAGNLLRAHILIQESLKGNRALGDIPGQLACVVAKAKCVLAEKDVKRAVALCALIEARIKADGVKLLEPDVKAMQNVFDQGRQSLDESAYQSAYEAGYSMKLEDEIMKLLAEEYIG
jgi:predicted ATPase